MHKAARIVQLALLLAGIFLVAACASDGISVAPTSQPSYPIHEDPRALVPDISELFPEFRLSETRELDNRTVARERDDPDLWLRRYEEHGRVGGVEVVYDSGEFDGDRVTVWISTFQTASGISAVSQLARDERGSEADLRTETRDAGGELIEVDLDIEVPDLGDSGTGWHLQIRDEVLGRTFDLVIKGISVRESNYGLTVEWASTRSNVLTSDLLQIMELLISNTRSFAQQ